MQEEHEDTTIGRRRLLRRASTIAAGVAGAGVASAMVASPAQAADGEAILIGRNNVGTATTGVPAVSTILTAGDDAHPALRVENATGAALSVAPNYATTAAPAGSIFVDEYGDFAAIGTADSPEPYVTYVYSPTWATMTVPIKPIRYVDTRTSAGRTHVTGATYDSSYRVMPKNSTTIPDAVFDLSGLFLGGYGAVQANLTVLKPTAQGYASLWPSGDWPGTSSINYGTALPEIANFTQTLIATDPVTNKRTIRLKTKYPAQFILDIVGFVVADQFAQLSAAAAPPGIAATGPQRVKQAPFRG